jgi:hypothetical protein
MVLCIRCCNSKTICNGRSTWYLTLIMNQCSNLETGLYIVTGALEHALDLVLCKVFQTYGINNIYYSYY